MPGVRICSRACLACRGCAQPAVRSRLHSCSCARVQTAQRSAAAPGACAACPCLGRGRGRPQAARTRPRTRRLRLRQVVIRVRVRVSAGLYGRPILRDAWRTTGRPLCDRVACWTRMRGRARSRTGPARARARGGCERGGGNARGAQRGQAAGVRPRQHAQHEHARADLRQRLARVERRGNADARVALPCGARAVRHHDDADSAMHRIDIALDTRAALPCTPSRG